MMCKGIPKQKGSREKMMCTKIQSKYLKICLSPGRQNESMIRYDHREIAAKMIGGKFQSKMRDVKKMTIYGHKFNIPHTVKLKMRDVKI